MNKKLFKTIGFFLLFVVIGGVMGYFIGLFLKDMEAIDQVNWWPILLSIPLAYLFVIAWHELGHAFAGVQVGFDWKMYVVGPFLWEKKNENWQFSWNKQTNLGGGLVVALPTTEERIADRFQWFSLGGPIASLVGCLLFIFPSFFVSPTWKFFFIILSFFHGLIFLVTAIPFRAGGFFSDGMRFLRLRKGNPVRDLEAEFLRLITLTQHGVRPKDWPGHSIDSMIKQAKKLSDPYLVYLYSYAFYHTLDGGDFESAEQHLENYIQLKDDLPESFQSMVWLDASYFQAFAMKNGEKAETFFQQFKEIPFIPKSYILATQAEMAWANGNEEEFELYKQLALEKMSQMMDKSMANALTFRLSQPRT